MERDSGATTPIKIAASSTANIFSDLNATSQQEPQNITSDDEQQSECPISIIPAPAKKAPEVAEQVQSDPSSNTMEVEELVQTDPKICDNQNTSPVLVAVGSHPKVIFLEFPNGDNKSQHQITDPQEDPFTNNTAQSVTNYEQDYSPANEIHPDQPRTSPPPNPANADKASTVTTSLYTTRCETPSGTSSVYAIPPVSHNMGNISNHNTEDV